MVYISNFNQSINLAYVYFIINKSEPPITTNESINNHIVPNDNETIKLRSHISILEPAPSNYELPKPLSMSSTMNISSNSIKPTLDPSTFTKQLIINKSILDDNHIAQPVDIIARELARSHSKPATWKDLYWSLIGKRNLMNDELKVKALFSWLCSIPVGSIPFLTYDELQQAEQDDIQYAKEALKNKSKKLKLDSPEFILNEMSYVKGLAKGVDYVVGMRLNDINDQLQQQQSSSSSSAASSSIMHRLQHAWNAAYLDNKWALFDPMWAAQRLAVSANTRLSQLVQTGQMDYETDMFYFNVDPAKFIYSHYPFDENWQMLKPPVTLKEFENSVLLKPAFFRHGLGLLSHQDCVILAPNKLVIKLSMPKTLTDTLKFTFNLKYEGKDDNLDLPNLSQFGIHELSRRDATVTFHFRFPKPGGYKLTLYAQRIGEKLFADICEYRVESKMSTDLQQTEPVVMDTSTTTTSNNNNNNDTSKPALTILPFPPTSQGHYGPAEKAKELDIITIPEDLETHLNFNTTMNQRKLPRLTARLKSSIHETSMLTDCILLRSIEATSSGSLISATNRLSGTQTIQGSRINMIILTAYLPTGGEYALEVYGAPADSDENTSYFLVWQFLINSEYGVRLSTPVRKRLATMNLGPQDETWSTLGLKLLSHDDPLIHVPTAGSIELRKTRSKSEIMSQYMSQGDKIMNGISTNDSLIVPTTSPDQTNEIDDEVQDPRSCDLKIRISKESQQKLYVVGQFVDISTPEEEVSDHFYKLYIYAIPINNNELPQSLPLVYTYLIEAPPRIMSSEIPYIGVKWGGFPEKLEQQQQHHHHQQQQNHLHPQQQQQQQNHHHPQQQQQQITIT
ncbi:uncharacterized protein DC041_0009085 [Schistosoma bovis]|uniref:KY-like immunoglobulin-like domain-containing protein n=1 Tax=Schistosoma bovis TaxID=6184 RepID=A0A430QDX4_SCHBO|nr:uncharacterized protein DC041_0009085 [Schistosoma bovis]